MDWAPFILCARFTVAYNFDELLYGKLVYIQLQLTSSWIADYAMSMKTVIVGDERSQFLYRSGDDSRNYFESSKYNCDAVALVFASDKDKPCGIYLFVYAFFISFFYAWN